MSTAPTHRDASAEHPEARSPWPRALVAGLGAAAVVVIVLLAFLWPTATSTPQHIDVDVVASPEAFDQLTAQAEQAAAARGGDLPFDLHRVDDRQDAVQDIRTREVYGAIVLPSAPEGKVEVLTARAANVGVATMLTQTVDAMVTARTQAGLEQAAQAMAAQGAPQDPAAAAQSQQQMLGQVSAALEGPTVTDVVPLSEDDPQGAGLAVAALPLTIGGIVGGMLLANTLRGTWRRLVGVLVYAIVAGIAMVLLLDTFFGFAPAPVLELWGAVTLSLMATVSLIVGLHGALGAPGLGIGAIITMLIGNPLSGAQSPPEFLPWHWGTIGQYFVPGATGTLVRDLSYFPDAPMLHAWLVLAGWTLLGLVLIAVGHRRTRGHARPSASA